MIGRKRYNFEHRIASISFRHGRILRERQYLQIDMEIKMLRINVSNGGAVERPNLPHKPPTAIPAADCNCET